jgi:hypothetical protein
MSEELRVCRKCHFEKPISEFTIIDKRTGRRKVPCRACEAARIKKRYNSDPKMRLEARQRTAKWRVANMAKTAVARRNSIIKSQYGLTPDQFDALLEAQDGKCALCHAEDHGRSTVKASSWNIDHNHQTGAVRGLLCTSCNTALGHHEKLLREVGEDALLDYLTRPCPVPPLPAMPVVEAFVPRYVADIPGEVLPPCSVDGCDRDGKWNGLCHTCHMNRFRARVLEQNGEAVVLHQRGATQWKTSLTDDDVRTIRASGKKGVDLALEYDVSRACISQILTCRTWKHVT